MAFSAESVHDWIGLTEPLLIKKLSVLDFFGYQLLGPIEFHPYLNQVFATTSNDLLVQAIPHTFPLKILREIRRCIDEKVERLATLTTPNIEKESLWRRRRPLTKQFFGKFLEHKDASSREVQYPVSQREPVPNRRTGIFTQK
jgi:hypothetical protein